MLQLSIVRLGYSIYPNWKFCLVVCCRDFFPLDNQHCSKSEKSDPKYYKQKRKLIKMEWEMVNET